MPGYQTRYSGGGAVVVGPQGLFTAGFYYAPSLPGNDATSSMAQSTEYAMPFIVAQRTSFDRIALEVTTQAAATTVRLGVRQDTGRGAPSTLMLDAGTVDSTSTGVKTITIDITLTPGLYWLTATLQGGTGVAVRSRSYSQQFAHVNASNANACSWSATGVTGALPAGFASPAPAQQAPKVMLRAA